MAVPPGGVLASAKTRDQAATADRLAVEVTGVKFTGVEVTGNGVTARLAEATGTVVAGHTEHQLARRSPGCPF